jgi:putative ABC transport system permease protein
VPAVDALKDQSERWLLQNDRGFTYISDLPAHSEVMDGEWWPSDYTGPPLISVVDDVVKAFDVKPGDKMVVNILGRDIEATIANTRTVNWMNFTVNFAISFAPGTLEAAPHSWLATVVADPAQETAIQRNIGLAFPNISMIRLSDAVNTAGALLGNMANAVRGTALVAIIAGILVLAGSLAATRTARVYDTVILKVLGTRRSTIISGFLLEFGLLGFIAAVVSLALGSMVSWAVMVFLMDLSWAFYPVPAILTLLAGIFLTLAISWAVMGNVLRSSPAIYLRNQ